MSVRQIFTKTSKTPPFRKGDVTFAMITIAFGSMVVLRRRLSKGVWSYGIDYPVKVRLTDKQAASFNRYLDACVKADETDSDKEGKETFKRLTKRSDRKFGDKIIERMTKESNRLREKGIDTSWSPKDRMTGYLIKNF
jgi:hypothetical protein